MAMTEPVSGHDWGFAPIPEADMAEAFKWHDIASRRVLDAVLDTCVSVQRAEHMYGVSYERITQKIGEKAIIAVDLGEAGHHIPTWQFVPEQPRGELVVRPDVQELWNLWGRGEDAQGTALDFCEIMILTPGRIPREKTTLQALDDNDTSVVEVVKYVIKNPFNHS